MNKDKQQQQSDTSVKNKSFKEMKIFLFIKMANKN